MKVYRAWIFCLVFSLIMAAVGVGCSGTPTTTPQQTTGTTETTGTDAAFKINVLPKELKGFSIAGQEIIFLITVSSNSPGGSQPVKISAQASGAKITVAHESIIAGEVAEVSAVPDIASVGKSITVHFKGQRGNLEETASVSFDVIEGSDDREAYALEMKAKFIAWLAAEHPELGISESTTWSGTMVSPQWLVVSHYLFFSAEWEMHVEWHVMVAPYDWVRIDLRHRFDQTKPGHAFEISSISAGNTPIAIEVPGEIWR